jgi:hypothetical protein
VATPVRQAALDARPEPGRVGELARHVERGGRGASAEHLRARPIVPDRDDRQHDRARDGDELQHRPTTAAGSPARPPATTIAAAASQSTAKNTNVPPPTLPPR